MVLGIPLHKGWWYHKGLKNPGGGVIQGNLVYTKGQLRPGAIGEGSVDPQLWEMIQRVLLGPLVAARGGGIRVLWLVR